MSHAACSSWPEGSGTSVRMGMKYADVPAAAVPLGYADGELPLGGGPTVGRTGLRVLVRDESFDAIGVGKHLSADHVHEPLGRSGDQLVLDELDLVIVEHKVEHAHSPQGQGWPRRTAPMPLHH